MNEVNRSVLLDIGHQSVPVEFRLGGVGRGRWVQRVILLWTQTWTQTQKQRWWSLKKRRNEKRVKHSPPPLWALYPCMSSSQPAGGVDGPSSGMLGSNASEKIIVSVSHVMTAAFYPYLLSFTVSLHILSALCPFSQSGNAENDLIPGSGGKVYGLISSDWRISSSNCSFNYPWTSTFADLLEDLH